jgi:hypothetical protein
MSNFISNTLSFWCPFLSRSLGDTTQIYISAQIRRVTTYGLPPYLKFFHSMMIPSIIHLFTHTHTHIHTHTYIYAIKYVLEQNLHVYWHLRPINLFLNECVHPVGWLNELVLQNWLFHIYNLWRVTKYKEKKKLESRLDKSSLTRTTKLSSSYTYSRYY